MAAGILPTLPAVNGPEGRPRRVGFEIEFSELRPLTAAEAIAAWSGGRIERRGPYEFMVDVPAFGAQVRIVLDWTLPARLSEERLPPADSFEKLKRSVATIVGEAAAATIVPCEVILPPIACDQLAGLSGLIETLRDAGAKGTTESLFYAFGVHINIEPPNCAVSTLHAYLAAYGCLQDWLFAQEPIDFSRRLTPFVAPYGLSYLDHLYAAPPPDELAALIDTYLRYNPTRNRALDMLPLWAWLDAPRVRKHVPEQKINPRPTFHYRLPNCRIHEPEWDLTVPWRQWLAVERLALDAEQRDALVQAFCRKRHQWLFWDHQAWAEFVDRTLDPASSS